MHIARLWAVGGVAALLLRSSFSLAAKGWETTVVVGLGALEWSALVLIVGAFLWGEGYRALVKAWAPFVVRRIHDLDDGSSAIQRLLAPLHATGLVASDRRLALRAWSAVALIVLAVVIVRALPHPWRGMIELGVAGALLLGTAGLLYHYVRWPASPLAANESPAARTSGASR